MVNVTQTVSGVPWDKRTPYERWVEDDLKLELQRGYAAGARPDTTDHPAYRIDNLLADARAIAA